MPELDTLRTESIQVDIRSGIQTPVAITGDVMVFTTFSFMFCGNILGWFGENATFTIGVLQLSLAGLFFVGARERMKVAPFWGNMNLIFAFYFGVLGGSTNVLAGLGVPLNGSVLSLANLLAGIVLFGTLPGSRRDPWTFFYSLHTGGDRCPVPWSRRLGIAPAVLYPIAAYCLAAWVFWACMPLSAT
jgi:hypothetical protein